MCSGRGEEATELLIKVEVNGKMSVIKINETSKSFKRSERNKN